MKLILTCLMIALAGFRPMAELAPDHPKVLKARRIFLRVGAAFGLDPLTELPPLVMYENKNSNRIAYFESLAGNSKFRSRLIIDEKLFDICESLDQGSGSALAFVIAHEIAHFQQKHRSPFSFAEKFPQKKSIGESILKASVRLESEADQLGLFQAYMAGFDPEPLVDQLFDSLYAAYRLQDVLPGYPSREIRKKQTHVDAANIRPLAYLFWGGQALFCRGFYNEAGSCYDKILKTPGNTKTYNFKEVYNNLGLTRLQEALAFMPNKKLRDFALPMELDAQNRLLIQHSRTDTKPEETLAHQKLAEADALFDKAITLDPNYKIAYLNRAAAWIMRGNYHMALGYLDEMAKRFSKTLPADWWTIYGLAQFGLNKNQAAKKGFTTAAKKSAIAAHNLRVLQSIEDRREKPLLIKGVKVPGCEERQPLFKEVSPTSALKQMHITALLLQSTPGPYLLVGLGNHNKQAFLKIELTGSSLLFALPGQY